MRGDRRVRDWKEEDERINNISNRRNEKEFYVSYEITFPET